MKYSSNKRFILIVTLLICGILTGSICCFIAYDNNKPNVYKPQLDYVFLQKAIEKIDLPDEEVNGEILINDSNVDGILVYGCSKTTLEEMNKTFKHISRNEYDGTHIVFPDDSYEIFVSAARYTPLIKAIGYGVWSFDGNIYAQKNSRVAAVGKPNFRNYFNFTIRKQDYQIGLTLYCNTNDASHALSTAINYFNEQ